MLLECLQQLLNNSACPTINLIGHVCIQGIQGVSIIVARVRHD